jgi:hypothetical protein
MREIRRDDSRVTQAKSDAEASEAWGYVVTPDGRVIKATEHEGVVLDDRGHQLGTCVTEDGQLVGAIVRAA